MPDHVDSVKEYLRLMTVWRKTADNKGEESQVASYDRRIAALQATVDEVEHLRRVTMPIPVSYGDLSDLPPELLKELAGTKVDEAEDQLFNIIKAGGGEVDLDAILIELYRRYKVLQTRKFLQNKLWRMAQKGVIHSVSGRKGVYSVQPTIVPNPPFRTSSFADDLDDDVPF